MDISDAILNKKHEINSEGRWEARWVGSWVLITTGFLSENRVVSNKRNIVPGN